MLEDTRRRALEKERLKAVEESVGVGDPAAPALHDERIESRYRFDVDEIVASVRREIIGQDEAIQAMERVLRIVRADIADARRPLHTALLLGPTGVGKTEMIRALARSLHGDPEAFCRVDMNTLSQEHYAAALTGAPPGYVGSREGNTVLDQELIEGGLHKPGIKNSLKAACTSRGSCYSTRWKRPPMKLPRLCLTFLTTVFWLSPRGSALIVSGTR